MRINDAVFGGVLLLSALAIILYARTFPSMQGQDYGSALFPTIIAIGFAICGAVLVWGGIRSGEVPGLVVIPDWMRQQGEILDVFLVLGGLVVLILVWNWVGFLIGATLYIGALIARFRHGKVASSFLVALIACFVIDFAFRRYLLVPLPLGPLTGYYW